MVVLRGCPMAALSTYELSRLDNMAQNQRKLTCLGLVQAPAVHPKQARRRAATPELITARRASGRRSEASLRRYDTLHLFGRDVAEWPLPGVRRSHTLLLLRLVLRGHEGQSRASPSRLAGAAGAAAGTAGAAAGTARAAGAAAGTAAGATAPRSHRLHQVEAEPPHEDLPAGCAEGPASGPSQGQQARVAAPPAIAPVVWV